jgi:hypothetical protein
MTEGHVDFPYADVAPDCSCCYGNDLLGGDSGIADVDSDYNVVGVNRNLVRVTYEEVVVARTREDRIEQSLHTSEVDVLGGSLDGNPDASSSEPPVLGWDIRLVAGTDPHSSKVAQGDKVEFVD